jgi:hypothetical protein
MEIGDLFSTLYQIHRHKTQQSRNERLMGVLPWVLTWEGGIHIRDKDRTEVTIRDRVIENCAGKGTGTGRGGGIYLHLEVTTANFELGLFRFEDNKANFGENVFALSNGLRRLVRSQSFLFAFTLDSREY